MSAPSSPHADISSAATATGARRVDVRACTSVLFLIGRPKQPRPAGPAHAETLDQVRWIDRPDRGEMSVYGRSRHASLQAPSSGSSRVRRRGRRRDRGERVHPADSRRTDHGPRRSAVVGRARSDVAATHHPSGGDGQRWSTRHDGDARHGLLVDGDAGGGPGAERLRRHHDDVRAGRRHRAERRLLVERFGEPDQRSTRRRTTGDGRRGLHDGRATDLPRPGARPAGIRRHQWAGERQRRTHPTRDRCRPTGRRVGRDGRGGRCAARVPRRSTPRR